MLNGTDMGGINVEIQMALKVEKNQRYCQIILIGPRFYGQKYNFWLKYLTTSYYCSEWITTVISLSNK